jgi:hypothetical protein
MSTNRVDVIYQVQTSETDTSLVLAPDGADGVVWVTNSGGGGSPNLDGGTATSTYGGITAIDGGTA